MLDRRTFVAGVLATTVAARPSVGQDKFTSLIQNQYAGNVVLQQIGGQYLGYDFTLSPGVATWELRLAEYRGRYCGNDVDLHGYWIFRPGVNRCWQAVNRGGGPLVYWNQDGHAVGNPEDWELFNFATVDASQQTVKIFNGSFGRSQTACGIHIDPNWRYLVGLTATTFSCNETGANAAIFNVQFV